MTTLSEMTIAAMPTAPAGILHAGTALLRPDMLALCASIAPLSSALPYTLEMFASRRMPAQTEGTLTSAEPAIGAVLGFLLLHQALPIHQALAIIPIVTAAAVAAVAATRRPEKAAAALPSE